MSQIAIRRDRGLGNRMVPLIGLTLSLACTPTPQTSATGEHNLSLSVRVTPRGALPASVGAPAAGLGASLDVDSTEAPVLVVTDDANVLKITSAELVVRKIELEGPDGEVEGSSSDVEEPGSEGEESGSEDEEPGSEGDDSGDEVHVGPMLLSLPLDGSVATALEVSVPAGTYGEVELQIHKPVGGSAQAQLVDAHPEFAGISVLVKGFFNESEVVFASDLTAVRHLALPEPLVVVEGVPAGLTFDVDVATWFVDATGALIDPAAAMSPGAACARVRDNIRRSIRGYSDGDDDGDDHADDGGGDDDDADDGADDGSSDSDGGD